MLRRVEAAERPIEIAGPDAASDAHRALDRLPLSHRGEVWGGPLLCQSRLRVTYPPVDGAGVVALEGAGRTWSKVSAAALRLREMDVYQTRHGAIDV